MVGAGDGPDGEGGGRQCGGGRRAEQSSRLVTAGAGGEDASALRLAGTVMAVGSETREHEPSALPGTRFEGCGREREIF